MPVGETVLPITMKGMEADLSIWYAIDLGDLAEGSLIGNHLITVYTIDGLQSKCNENC